MNDKNKILTVSDLANLVKLNKATIYNYIKEGLLYEPNYKVGLTYSYNTDDIAKLREIIKEILALKLEIKKDKKGRPKKVI